MSRASIYDIISKATGEDFHNGSLRDVKTAAKAYEAAIKIQLSLMGKKKGKNK